MEVPSPDDPEGVSETKQTVSVLKKLGWPYAVTRLDANTAGALDIFHRSFLSLRRPLPLPASFLIDAQDRLAVIYRGPVSVDQLRADCALLPLSPDVIRAKHLPFQGRWVSKIPQPHILSALVAWKREGYLNEGRAYLERQLPLERKRAGNDPTSVQNLLLLCEHLADFYRLSDDQANLPRAYQTALEILPTYVPALTALGNHYGHAGQLDRSLTYLQRAQKQAPKDPNVLLNLGVAYAKSKQYEEARQCFRDAVVANPGNLEARLNYCQMLLNLKEWQAAGQEIRHLWRAMPGQRNVSNLVQQLRPHLNPQEEASLRDDLRAVLRDVQSTAEPATAGPVETEKHQLAFCRN